MSDPDVRTASGFEILNPAALGEPRGWNNGLLWRGSGNLLFVAGQTPRGASGRVETRDFVEQFDLALERVLEVVAAAGGRPHHIGRLTVYVTDLAEYRTVRKELGGRYRERMGKHYPAMALVEVAGLLDEGARVEIEATAVIPRKD